MQLGRILKLLNLLNLKSVLKEFSGKIIGLDPETTPVWFKNVLEGADANIKMMSDPCIKPKAIKSASEQNAIRLAHQEDGVALVKFLYWLEQQAGNRRLTELDAAEKLLTFRQESSFFHSESFPTIAGFGANGAIIHYRATEENHAQIIPPGLFLIDSGGQYEWGTTDITRTVALGEISKEARTNFTYVLKGHIALALAEFDCDTTGKELDRITRKPLQDAGLDYAHGTGHGVGCYLSVHESGAGVSPRFRDCLEPGMLLSNEPGYYEEGVYGIRIENLILVQEQTPGQLFFETISLAPIDRKLIVKNLLSEKEINWLNDYHNSVWKNLCSKIEDQNIKDWLREETLPL